MKPEAEAEPVGGIFNKPVRTGLQRGRQGTKFTMLNLEVRILTRLSTQGNVEANKTPSLPTVLLPTLQVLSQLATEYHEAVERQRLKCQILQQMFATINVGQPVKACLATVIPIWIRLRSPVRLAFLAP